MDAIKILGSLLGNNATGGSLLDSLTGGGRQTQIQPQSRGGSGGGLLGSLLGMGQKQSSGRTSGGGGLLGSLVKGALAKHMRQQQTSPRRPPTPPPTDSRQREREQPTTQQRPSSPHEMSTRDGGLLAEIFGDDASHEQELKRYEPKKAVDEATILIRAMCNAAKSDGQIDDHEQQQIIGRMGELTQSEVDFLRKELSSPLDVKEFVRSVPSELAPQVYALSVMTVKVDTRKEVEYLRQLGQGLRLDAAMLNEIHQQLGVA